MVWNEEKIIILEDEYAYADIAALALKLGTTQKGVKRKAEKLNLKRATNNQIIDGNKYCSLCKTEHPISHFYRNKSKSNGYEYHCKKYYQLKSTSNKIKHTTQPLPYLNIGGNATEKRSYVNKRPRNPIIVINNIEGKVCNSCKQWKTLSSYWTDKNGIAQRKATCIECYKNRYSKVK